MRRSAAGCCAWAWLGRWNNTGQAARDMRARKTRRRVIVCGMVRSTGPAGCGPHFATNPIG